MKHAFMFKVMAAALAVSTPALAQPAAPAAPAAASPPQTPLTQVTVAAVEKVCLPILRGGQATAVATAAGFKLQDGAWTKDIDGKPSLDVDPPDVANPHLCTVTVSYAPGGGAQLRAALGAWASGQTPPLAPVQVNQGVAGSPDLTTSQWAGQTGAGVESVVLSQEKPGQGGLAQSTLLVSLSPT